MKKFLIAIALVSVGFALGYYAGRHSLPLTGTIISGQAASSGTRLGPWAANFRIPGSVQIPDKTPLMKCDFKRDKFEGVNVTITNLTGHPYLVTYSVYGYDAKGRRVSDGDDQFTIGGHESVARKPLLISRAEGFIPEIGRTFSVQMMLEE